MLTEQEIDDLVARGEGSKTEFKQELHYSRSKHEEAEFVKDVMSLVNSHGPGTAYLLIGIDDATSQPHDVAHLGLSENNLQQFLRQRIAPPVRFHFHVATYQGVPIAVLEIPRSRTRFHLSSTDVRDDKKIYLPKGMIYIRDGSSKREISTDDFTHLRAEFQEAARLEAEQLYEPDRPDIEVSFQEKKKRHETALHWTLMNDIYQQQMGRGIEFRVMVPLYVRNEGTAVAKDLKLTLGVPDGCMIDTENSRYISFHGASQRLQKVRVDIEKLANDGQELTTANLCVIVPYKDRAYEVTWTAIADGMKGIKQGRVEVYVKEQTF
jgi:hypothetical protein